MVSALYDPGFDAFARGDFRAADVTCMMEYDPWYGLPTAFSHEMPPVVLGEVLSDAGLPQFHCAETEKYAHVTFFFNGGRSDPFPGEERCLIPSPQVATYDLQPEMSAPEVADAVIAAIESRAYAFIVVNFANGDMVGHTAVRNAVLSAVETLDREAGRVIDSAQAHGYSVLLTADHGNCDEMIDPLSGEPHTRHTVYPVPCLVVDEMAWRLRIGAGIEDVAPTVLQLMGLPQPEAMQGKSILLKPAQK
jgi:2,3-bisphosphoglycerate-independent phosphoglycerate mutase